MHDMNTQQQIKINQIPEKIQRLTKMNSSVLTWLINNKTTQKKIGSVGEGTEDHI